MMHPKNDETTSPIRSYYFLAIFISLSAVLGATWLGLSFFQQAIDTGTQKVTAQQQSDRIKYQIENFMRTYIRELTVASNIDALKNYLKASSENSKTQAINYFQLLLETNAAISQIRYIDHLGQEKIRVQRIQNQIVTVSDDDLQDKSARYYFTETQQLDAGDVFISPLDLNIENEVIETPWAPTLRLATPLDNGNAKLGVFIINFNVTELLSDLTQHINKAWEPILVNQNGYYLAGAPKEKLWGFMFNKNETLLNDSPELWQFMTSANQGIWKNSNTIQAFSRVDITRLTQSIPLNLFITTRNVWFVVTRSPVQPLIVWSAQTIVTLLFALLVIALVAWFWSQSIVQRRRAEQESVRNREQLVNAERMASIGELVAGVSHELNTPVGNAVTIASTLADMTEDISVEIEGGQLRKTSILKLIEEYRSGCDCLLKSLQRASELVSSFKEISVDQNSESRRRFLLNQYLEEIVVTLNPRFRHSPISLLLEPSPYQITMDSYPGTLGQVIMNLINNAQTHAFPEPNKSHSIRVSCRRVGSNLISIAVEDNGIGMDKDTLRKIYDPFFTTKLGQGGSGLGLSIVHNLVTNILGGRINVSSSPGFITKFEIIIPTTAPVPAVQEVPSHVE